VAVEAEGDGDADAEPDDDDLILGVMALREFEDSTAVADEMYFFDDPDLIPAAERYGHLEMGYVRDGATGRGIGSRLLERLHEIGVDAGVDLFLADSWVPRRRRLAGEAVRPPRVRDDPPGADRPAGVGVPQVRDRVHLRGRARRAAGRGGQAVNANGGPA